MNATVLVMALQTLHVPQYHPQCGENTASISQSLVTKAKAGINRSNLFFFKLCIWKLVLLITLWQQRLIPNGSVVQKASSNYLCRNFWSYMFNPSFLNKYHLRLVVIPLKNKSCLWRKVLTNIYFAKNFHQANKNKTSKHKAWRKTRKRKWSFSLTVTVSGHSKD